VFAANLVHNARVSSPSESNKYLNLSPIPASGATGSASALPHPQLVVRPSSIVFHSYSPLRLPHSPFASVNPQFPATKKSENKKLGNGHLMC
jgi:hypothetical protein